MKTTLYIICCLTSVMVGHSQQQSHSNRTLTYCTNVGPVEITIRGDSAVGRYLLTVTPELKKGIIKGTYSKGLIEGIWDDPDGVGRIIIGFNPDHTRFLAMYNTSKDASHWYNEWKGVAKDIYLQLNADQKRDLVCDWK